MLAPDWSTVVFEPDVVPVRNLERWVETDTDIVATDLMDEAFVGASIPAHALYLDGVAYVCMSTRCTRESPRPGIA